MRYGQPLGSKTKTILPLFHNDFRFFCIRASEAISYSERIQGPRFRRIVSRRNSRPSNGKEKVSSRLCILLLRDFRLTLASRTKLI